MGKKADMATARFQTFAGLHMDVEALLERVDVMERRLAAIEKRLERAMELIGAGTYGS